MGCDIHMYAERNCGDYWLCSGEVFKDKYFNPNQPLHSYNKILTDEPYQGRNYTLFSLLADVRNNYHIKPISKPRGLPDDVDEEIKKKSDEWDCDGHSHSYFTLEELLAVDWDFTVINNEGLVDEKNYKLFKEIGRPGEWCGWTNNENYKKVKWKTSLREYCRDFIDSLYDVREWGRVNKTEPKDIRLVFWFDN